MSTNIFSGADQFKPDEEIIIDTVLFSLSVALGVIWVIQFIIGIVCISAYIPQQKYNPYVYIYTAFFTFKWFFAGAIVCIFSGVSWLIIRSFCIQISWSDFKSGWISLFYLITAVELLISVPMGLHALHISKTLPLIFTIFIYLEVFMSALHIVHALIDRILYVYSNDKDLIEQMEQLPSKTRKQALKDMGQGEDPYSRANTGFRTQNIKGVPRKQKKVSEIKRRLSIKPTREDLFKIVPEKPVEETKVIEKDSLMPPKPSNERQRRSIKPNNEFNFWDMIKAGNIDNSKIKNSPARRKSNMVEVFNQNVLSKFNTKSENQKALNQ